MKTSFLLFIVALLPVGHLSALIYLAERTKTVRKIPYALARQIITGILFGGLAIIGTEFGIEAATVQ